MLLVALTLLHREIKLARQAIGAQVIQSLKNLGMLPTIVAIIFMLLIDEIKELKNIILLLLIKQKIEMRQPSILQVLLTMLREFI